MTLLQKSFSTSDITQLPSEKQFDSSALRSSGNGGECHSGSGHHQMRHAFSEMALNSIQRCGYMLDARLDHTSRSCSTWVAVGDVASSSQLPSPHGGPASSSKCNLTYATTKITPEISPQPSFTAADLIRSVNKKVRENYIRGRLLTTIKAVERLSQSEFNLDQLVLAAHDRATWKLNNQASNASPINTANLSNSPGPTKLIVPTICTTSTAETTSNPIIEIENDLSKSINIILPTPSDETITTSTTPVGEIDSLSSTQAATAPNSISLPVKKNVMPNVSLICPKMKSKIGGSLNRNLTIHDIEKERGRPLSKYDRNMMIFNWLHSLDETSTADD